MEKGKRKLMEKGKRSLCLEPLEREHVEVGDEVEIVTDTGAQAAASPEDSSPF